MQKRAEVWGTTKEANMLANRTEKAKRVRLMMVMKTEVATSVFITIITLALFALSVPMGPLDGKRSLRRNALLLSRGSGRGSLVIGL